MTTCEDCWHYPSWCRGRMQPCTFFEPRADHPGLHFDRDGNRVDRVKRDDGTWVDVPHKDKEVTP